MRLILVILFCWQFIRIDCLADDYSISLNSTDTTLHNGIIALRIGYFPYHSKMKSAGLFLSISSNSSTNDFLGYGYYFSFYGGKHNPGSQGGLICGGFNFGYKTNVFNTFLLVKIATFLVISSAYPSFGNVVEFDTPLYLFDDSSIDISLSCGLLRFATPLPITFSIGYSF